MFFVVYDKETGYVKMTSTGDPTKDFNLVDNWKDHYVIDEAPGEIILLTEYFLRVEGTNLSIIGRIEDLKANGRMYEYTKFAKLFKDN